MNDPDKERLDVLLREAAAIIQSKPDDATPELIGDGILDELLDSIAPRKTDKNQSIYDYFLQNKHRLQLIALLRYAIQQNFSVAAVANGHNCFVSPDFHQWYDGGVMFLQGVKRFEGSIGLYKDGEVRFGVSARDIKSGEKIGPDDLVFHGVEEIKRMESERIVPSSAALLDLALAELEAMLNRREDDEAKYQSFFTRYPWVLGAQYTKIDSHVAFDDQKIPDFTGVRSRDGSRDIVEIKQPFLSLFCQDGQFRSEFHRAWQQAENYLEFAIADREYLLNRKGLRFENPHCYLLIGHGLSDSQIASLRRKQTMNPRITILSYEDVLALGRNTAKFIKEAGHLNERAE